MTPLERRIIERLTYCYSDFRQLPMQHAADDPDFAAGIHQLQRIVMARVTQREHPEFFKPGRTYNTEVVSVDLIRGRGSEEVDAR